MSNELLSPSGYLDKDNSIIDYSDVKSDLFGENYLDLKRNLFEEPFVSFDFRYSSNVLEFEKFDFPKERYAKDKFYLEHLEMKIEFPEYIRVRYYSNLPTLEDRIENPDKEFGIGKSSDEILEELTKLKELTEEDKRREVIDKEVGGAVKLEIKDGILYLDIILPSEFKLISEYGPLVGFLQHEFTCGHEEAHVLQETHNYTKLINFIKKYLGENEYL